VLDRAGAPAAAGSRGPPSFLSVTGDEELPRSRGPTCSQMPAGAGVGSGSSYGGTDIAAGVWLEPGPAFRCTSFDRVVEISRNVYYCSKIIIVNLSYCNIR
jgi:hypothetical protein